MNYAILSDIHANLTALEAVLYDMEHCAIDACFMLGDIIDYGMRPNEVIERLQTLKYSVLCSIRGNHEDAVLKGSYNRFSSPRGSEAARFTTRELTEESYDYLHTSLSVAGKQEVEIDGHRVLCIHGSLDDEYWGTISANSAIEGFESYDFVLSGHSHRPHLFARYYQSDNELMRGQKKTTFINPGSIGQPRNHNACAQYAILSMPEASVDFRRVPYDVNLETSLYKGQIDLFYAKRLELGV